MRNNQKVCLVTIHGIGFQQSPRDGMPGYADGLHESLARELGGRLGSDPQRGHGPVYVMSAKPGTRDTEWGLNRLEAPLTAGDEPIAHVAVVYNPLEGVGPRLLTGAATVAEAGLEVNRYASVTGTIRLAVGDAWAAWREHPAADAPDSSPPPPPPSLRPRDDLPRRTGAHHRAFAASEDRARAPRQPGVIRALEDDVVGYVARNDLRESIQAFVAEVLRRLRERPDVGSVVVNAHSQGTVVAFDVLRGYPAPSAPPGSSAPVGALVTAGSPLRKYADLFSWGNDAGGIQAMRWLNFYDEKDPVADPLDPPADWRFGNAVTRRPGELGLLWATDPGGGKVRLPIQDIRVDNLRNTSGGGLRAHNYWANTTEVIPALCEILTETGTHCKP